VPLRHRPAGLPIPSTDRCLVMGVLNVTPDSFSDGGQYASTSAAIARGIALSEQGADIVDVGGESTRPGAERVSGATESDRVVPVVAALSQLGICVSVDTMRAQTARGAVAAGAAMVNDVSGGLADPKMLPSVAKLAVPVILMHWRAHSVDMAQHQNYQDVRTDVLAELLARVEAADSAGVDPSRLILDPGIGFAKTADQNWELLGALSELTAGGFPMLVGASRKRFLGSLLADVAGPRPVGDREAATTAITALAAQAGAWCVRVHNVAASADAVRVVEAWAAQSPSLERHA
jgi:dihydropteroate synthase